MMEVAYSVQVPLGKGFARTADFQTQALADAGLLLQAFDETSFWDPGTVDFGPFKDTLFDGLVASSLDTQGVRLFHGWNNASLASISVGLGLISLGLGAAWNDIATLFNTTHAQIIHLMVGLAKNLAALRYGAFYVPQPPIAWMIAGYALLSATILLWVHQKRKHAIALASISLGLMLVPVIRHAFSRDLRMDVIDVGNGQAILLSGPGFHRVLMDAGSEHQAESVVEPFLRTRGVNALDLIILTHGDALHYGGIRKLLPTLPIQRVVVPDAPFRSKPYRILLDNLRKAHIPLEIWHAGDTRTLPCGRIQVAWPPSGKTSFAKADDLGLVFCLQTDFNRLLFATDAGKTLEGKFSSTLPIGRCDALIQGLHGHEDSFTEPWLHAVHPQTILALTGDPPSPDLKTRWQTCEARILHTDQCGGVILWLRPGAMAIEPFFSPDKKVDGSAHQ